MVENSRFYAPKLKIDFLEALSTPIGDDLSLLSALCRLKIDIWRVLDHCPKGKGFLEKDRVWRKSKSKQ